MLRRYRKPSGILAANNKNPQRNDIGMDETMLLKLALISMLTGLVMLGALAAMR